MPQLSNLNKTYVDKALNEISTNEEVKIILVRISMCEKCKEFDCCKNKALQAGIAILVVVMVSVSYLLWLFVSNNKEPFVTGNRGSTTTSAPAEIFTRDNVFNATSNSNNIFPQSVALRKPLYIGIMTTSRYINTRAAVCNKTWGQNPVISKLEFFANLPSNDVLKNHPDIINIPG